MPILRPTSHVVGKRTGPEFSIEDEKVTYVRKNFLGVMMFVWAVAMALSVTAGRACDRSSVVAAGDSTIERVTADGAD